MNTTAVETKRHPFEVAGLGLAPFRFVSLEHRIFRACADAPVQVGGSCDFCGTGISYFYWIESADGKRFKVGSDCVAKTDPVLHAEIKRAAATERASARASERDEEERAARASKVSRANAYIDGIAGLRAAFEAGASAQHAILADLHARLVQFGSLSEKQIAFALRLGDEIRNPKPAEVHVPAPEGRVTFRGTVVAIREVQDHYSYRDDAVTLKMIVRVEAEGGCWLCWSTIPLGTSVEKGDALTITATLSRGKDAHFAFGKRPVVWTEEGVAAAAAKAAAKAARAAAKAARVEAKAARRTRCSDCGATDEMTGHQTCQYPQDHA